MNWKFAISTAALAAMCLAPLGTAQADKNKKKKNEALASAVEESAPPLVPGQATFYVTIRGAKQGNFKGQSTSGAHRNEIMGLQFLLQLASPRDTGTGQASGRRQYSAIVFTKQWDASSPQIFEAASTNESLPLVEFDFVRTAPDGREFVFETIKLTEATISGVKDYIGFPDSGEPPDARPLEDVSITFRKIEVSNTEGRTIFMDEWNSSL